MSEKNFEEENNAFSAKCETAFRKLFDAARAKNELHFTLSLNPEFRGEQGPGWCTAQDAAVAFDQYLDFVTNTKDSPIKARIALAFYSHLSEASGFYEVPKNMLRVCEGLAYNLWPLQALVTKDKITGKPVAPNANKVMRDLAEHASALGHTDLAEVFRDAFDADLRNGYAHADYILWDDGIRLRKRNGGHPRIVSWEEFTFLFNRGVNFYLTIRAMIAEGLASYDPPKTIKGRLSNNEPEMNWTIAYSSSNGGFRISTGH
jgi:hypothetical protein